MITSSGVPIEIVKGEPFATTITAGLCTTGQFNFSGYYFDGGIRYRYTDPDIVKFDIGVVSDISGILAIGLSAAQTSGLPMTECIYYVKAIPSGGGLNVDLLNNYARVYPL